MRSLAASALAILSCNAQAAERMSYGQAEYLNSCAVCHGLEGRGDGPLGEVLMKRPADLTRLSRENGGEFPYTRVFAVIDGRNVVRATANATCPCGAANSLKKTLSFTARAAERLSPPSVSMNSPATSRHCNDDRTTGAAAVRSAGAKMIIEHPKPTKIGEHRRARTGVTLKNAPAPTCPPNVF